VDGSGFFLAQPGRHLRDCHLFVSLWGRYSAGSPELKFFQLLVLNNCPCANRRI
jgi:hypothetical protein